MHYTNGKEIRRFMTENTAAIVFAQSLWHKTQWHIEAKPEDAFLFLADKRSWATPIAETLLLNTIGAPSDYLSHPVFRNSNCLAVPFSIFNRLLSRWRDLVAMEKEISRGMASHLKHLADQIDNMGPRHGFFRSLIIGNKKSAVARIKIFSKDWTEKAVIGIEIGMIGCKVESLFGDPSSIFAGTMSPMSKREREEWAKHNPWFVEGKQS